MLCCVAQFWIQCNHSFFFKLQYLRSSRSYQTTISLMPEVKNKSTRIPSSLIFTTLYHRDCYLGWAVYHKDPSVCALLYTDGRMPLGLQRESVEKRGNRLRVTHKGDFIPYRWQCRLRAGWLNSELNSFNWQKRLFISVSDSGIEGEMMNCCINVLFQEHSKESNVWTHLFNGILELKETKLYTNTWIYAVNKTICMLFLTHKHVFIHKQCAVTMCGPHIPQTMHTHIFRASQAFDVI